MLGALERVQEEIARRRRAQEEALAAKQTAEESSRAKSVFLANMSHELRTPLNAIIGYSEMLREDAAENRNRGIADLARITRRRHLLALINEVLDLSKVEAGKTGAAVGGRAPAQILRGSSRRHGGAGAKKRQPADWCTAPPLSPIVDLTKFCQSLVQPAGTPANSPRTAASAADVGGRDA